MEIVMSGELCGESVIKDKETLRINLLLIEPCAAGMIIPAAIPSYGCRPRGFTECLQIDVHGGSTVYH